MSSNSLTRITQPARKARAYAIAIAQESSNIHEIATVIDDAINAAVLDATRAPEFFNNRQLQARYGITRKTVQKLPIPRHQVGGQKLYKLADVLAYEADIREEPQTA